MTGNLLLSNPPNDLDNVNLRDQETSTAIVESRYLLNKFP